MGVAAPGYAPRLLPRVERRTGVCPERETEYTAEDRFPSPALEEEGIRGAAKGEREGWKNSI